MTQVVFLRGVNVGGHKPFQPSALAKQLKDCDVVNIGAAGTFVVRNPISPTDLRLELRRRLPFEAEIIICSGREMITAAAANPFIGQPSDPDIVQFVSVMAKRPRELPRLPLILPADNWLLRLLAIHGRLAFGLYRGICTPSLSEPIRKTHGRARLPRVIGIHSTRLSESSNRMPRMPNSRQKVEILKTSIPLGGLLNRAHGPPTARLSMRQVSTTSRE